MLWKLLWPGAVIAENDRLSESTDDGWALGCGNTDGDSNKMATHAAQGAEEVTAGIHRTRESLVGKTYERFNRIDKSNSISDNNGVGISKKSRQSHRSSYQSIRVKEEMISQDTNPMKWLTRWWGSGTDTARPVQLAEIQPWRERMERAEKAHRAEMLKLTQAVEARSPRRRRSLTDVQNSIGAANVLMREALLGKKL